MDALELFSQRLQSDISDFKLLEFFHRCQDVITTGTRAAVALPGIMQLLGEAELPSVLTMAAVDNIAKRVHAFLRIVVKPNPAPSLAIDAGDLLAST